MGDTVVSVEFRDKGGNETEVVITHEGFSDPARMDRHQQGWTELLTLLEHAVV